MDNDRWLRLAAHIILGYLTQAPKLPAVVDQYDPSHAARMAGHTTRLFLPMTANAKTYGRP